MTVRFRCFALQSNQELIDREEARRRGIDAFVESPQGALLDIAEVTTADLRTHVGTALQSAISDALRAGSNSVALTLGQRKSWTKADLVAIDLGLLDGASTLPAHPIDRAYPPPNVRD